MAIKIRTPRKRRPPSIAKLAKRVPRVDTVEAAVEAIQNASHPLPQPPVHMHVRPQERPYFDALMKTKARSEWNPFEISLAVQVARLQYQIDHETALLQEEQSVIRRGNEAVINSRLSVLELLQRRQLAFARTLKIGGSAAGKDRKTERNRRALEKRAREIHEGLADEDEDDLLPRG